MYKIWEYITQGYKNTKTQKNKQRLSLLILSLSFVVYIVVNSIAGSANDSRESILSAPEYRSLTIYADDNKHREILYQELLKEQKTNEKITDVRYRTGIFFTSLVNIEKYYGIDELGVSLNHYLSAISEYTVSGRTDNIKEDEIILPEYIYGVGEKTNYEYYKGSDLLGEIITIQTENVFTKEKLNYEFKVVGTYDNVKSMSEKNFYVEHLKLSEINEDTFKISEEEKKEFIDNNGYEEYVIRSNSNFNNMISVYIGLGYDLQESSDEIINNLRNKGMTFWSQVHPGLDEEITNYFNEVIIVGNLIAGLLLIIAIINIIVSSINEVRNRLWEFALKKTMGYSFKDLFSILLVERVINLYKSIVVAIIVTLIIVAGGNYWIQELFAYGKQFYELKLDMQASSISLIIMIITSAIAVIFCIPVVLKTNIIKTLKAE